MRCVTCVSVASQSGSNASGVHVTLLLHSVRLKRIHGNVCAIEGTAIANIDNPNWILDLRVSSCGFCCHLTGEDAAEIPQTFDCAAAELNALMMPGYHPAVQHGHQFVFCVVLTRVNSLNELFAMIYTPNQAIMHACSVPNVTDVCSTLLTSVKLWINFLPSVTRCEHT